MSISSREVRLLLRALGDPPKMRRSALASRLVAPGAANVAGTSERAERIRAVVRGALSAIASFACDHRTAERRRRAARIIDLCDLVGRSHESVSAQLGLSRRQFYRDRLLGLDLLADELEGQIRIRRSTIDLPCENANTAFDIADALIGIGKFDDAEALLRRTASTCGPENRFRAIARSMECATETGDHSRAKRAVEFAEMSLSRLEPVNGLLKMRIDLARTAASELLGDAGFAGKRRKLLEELRTTPISSDERWETLALALTQHASASNTRGNFSNALALLHEAEAVLRRCERPPRTLSALIPNLLGVTMMMMPGSLSAAAEQHRRATALASQRGLVRIAVASTLNGYAIDLWQGRAAQVFVPALDTLNAARGMTSVEEFGRMLLLVSNIALGSDQVNQALQLLDEVKTCLGDCPRLLPRALLVEAQARMKCGEYARASKIAEEAIEAAHDCGESSLVGTALLFAAESHIGTEEPELAKAFLVEAIATLKSSGSTRTYERAQELSVRLNA